MTNKTIHIPKENLHCYLTEFDNLVEMARYVQEVQINKVFEDEELASTELGTDGGWRDYITFDEAVKVLEYGTDKYLTTFVSHFKLAKQYLDEHITKTVSGFKNDVMGFVPIVPNVLSGNPINMINVDIKPKKIPTARIYIDRATSCGYKADVIVRFQSLIFALIQVLEDSGIRCEIYVVDTAYEDKESIVTSLKIKEYTQPLNLYKIQFPVVSPDYFRRIGFRMIESEPNIDDPGWRYGYGKPLATKVSNRFKVKDGKAGEGYQKIFSLKDTDVYIPSLNEFGRQDSELQTDKLLTKLLTMTGFKQYFNLDLKETKNDYI